LSRAEYALIHIYGCESSGSFAFKRALMVTGSPCSPNDIVHSVGIAR
jgi:hypothetical protein